MTFVAYILWQTLDQATMSHGLDAQQVNNLPHCHIFFGHMTDARDIALTWKTTLFSHECMRLYPSNHLPAFFLADCTDDHDEEEQHLFDHTVPLKEFILQSECQFITNYYIS